MSDNRIQIGFDVDKTELEKLDSAIKTITNFNNQIDKIGRTSTALANAYDKARKANEKMNKETHNMGRLMREARDTIKKSQFEMNHMTASANALRDSIAKHNRNVQVAVKDNGRLNASFEDQKGNVIKLTKQWDEQKQKFIEVGKEVKVVNNLMKELEKRKSLEDKELGKLSSMDGERVRIAPMRKGAKEWDIYSDAILKNHKVLNARMSKDGKWQQTLIDHSGKVRKLEGYYERYSKSMGKATHAVAIYSKRVSDASRGQMAQAGYSKDVIDRIGRMADSQKGLNKYTLSWNEAMKISALRMVQWSISGTFIFGTQRALRAMMGTIIELDTQMTELKKVMSSDTDFDAVLGKSIRLADRYGQKVTDINEAMIEFGRQGLDEKQIGIMAEAVTLMSNVGDIDPGEAASRLTGTMTVFKKDFGEANGIVDRFNEVQNNYATTVDILSTSVQKASGTAATFGIDLEHLIGYTTAIGEATRESGNVIGNSLKTVASRVTTMGGAMDSLSQIGVDVFDPITKDARPVQDILGDLHGKWGTLNDSQKQNISIQVAGRYQVSRFLALMNNYETAIDATTTAQNSYGSAAQENETYMKSLQARINKLWAAFQELANTIGESGIAKAFGLSLEWATKLVHGVNTLIGSYGKLSLAGIGIISTFGTVVGTFQSTKKNLNAVNGSFSKSKSIINNSIPSVTAFAEKMKIGHSNALILSSGLGRVKNSVKNLARATLTSPLFWVPAAIGAVTTLVGHFAELKRKQEEWQETAKNSAEEFQAFKDSISDYSVDEYAINKYKEQTIDLADEFRNLNDLMSNMDGVKEVQAAYADNIEATGQYARNTEQLKKNLEKKSEAETETALATESVTSKTQDALATLGIFIDKNDTLKDLQLKVSNKFYETKDAVAAAEDALIQAKEDAVVPMVGEIDEMTTSLDEAKSSWENTLGFSEKYREELESQINQFLILKDVKNRTASQEQVYQNILDSLSDKYGVSTDYIENNADAIVNRTEKEMKSLDSIKKSADEIEDAEDRKKAARKTSNKVESENERADKERKKRMNNLEKAATDYRIKHQNKLKRNVMEVSDKIDGSYADIRKTTDKTKTDTGKDLDSVGNKNKELNKTVERATGNMRNVYDRTTANISKNSKSSKEKLEDVGNEWKDLRDLFKHPLKALMNLKITGIFGGLLGAGGEIDGDQLKDKVMSAGGGSIAGNGFGGLVKTSNFGYRKDPFTGRLKFHAGMDLAGAYGSAVVARQGGRVLSAGYAGGLGNMVEIQGTNGLVYRYGHNSSLHVRPGQFVPAGAMIARMGSTGNSTGPHLHFEVRRNGIAINPQSYYHSGGVVNKQKRNNEVDARLQVGEMVLTKSQQAKLFNIVSGRNANSRNLSQYHAGGVVGGVGGSSTYTIKSGDTLSEIAVRFKTTIKSLMALNKQIKDANRIYAGDILKIAQTVKKGSSSAATYSNFYNPYKGEYSDRVRKIDELQSMMIYNDSDASYALAKGARAAVKTDEDKADYNRQQIEIFKQMSSLTRMQAWLKSSKLYMTPTELGKVKDYLTEIVKGNYVEKLNKSTDEWLNGFNSNLKVAIEKVNDFMSLSDQLDQRRKTERRNNFVDSYVKDLADQLGFKGEDLTELEKMQKQADELKNKIESRLEETADIQYMMNDPKIRARRDYLGEQKNVLQSQINHIAEQMRSQGITDSSTITSAQQPLRDRLAEIKDEYNALSYALENGTQTMFMNKKELKELVDQYNELQSKLDTMNNKREFTDAWGNVVRDAENNIRMINEQANTLIDTFQNVKRQSDSAASVNNQTKQQASSYVPKNNANTETSTFEADTNVTRNVTYVIQVGNVVSSQADLKEFAKYLKSIIDDEESRDG